MLPEQVCQVLSKAGIIRWLYLPQVQVALLARLTDSFLSVSTQPMDINWSYVTS